MKTIMYILTDVNLGGSAQSLLDMLRGMRARIRPVVIIPREGLIEKCLRNMDIIYYKISFPVRFCKIGKSSPKLEDNTFREDYQAALRLQEIIEKERVELIHTNSSVCNVGAIAAVLSNKPHVWHLRELLEEHFECEFIDGRFKSELFQHTDTFIAISNCVKDIYEHKFGMVPVCIYNGLSTQEFSSGEAYHDNGNTFLLAGRISEGKGQWDAVLAVELLVSQGWDDVSLTIVGDSEQKMIWSVRKYIDQNDLSENIRILPFQQDLSDLRRKHTYALTCSKMEALGRTTIEAMLFGNTVIGADTGGTSELIGSHNERGYTYRQGDYENLAKVMKQVMTESKEKKLLKLQSAEEYARKTFDLKTYADKMESLYNGVLSSSEKKHEEKSRLADVIEKRYKNISDCQEKGKNLGVENKFKVMFKYTELWLRLKQRGYVLTDFFSQRGICSIGIYGMGFLGCDLYDELEGQGIEIRYVMDQSPETVDKIIPVIKIDEQLPPVDAIVITTFSGENEIQELLRKKCPYIVLKLSEILELSAKDMYLS